MDEVLLSTQEIHFNLHNFVYRFFGCIIETTYTMKKNSTKESKKRGSCCKSYVTVRS